MILIPHSCESRNRPTHAQLVMRVHEGRAVNAFEGRLFRCGSKVELADLRPAGEYPETPLLIEFAGNDRKGWGHRRSSDINVLWQLNLETGAWIELARIKSKGADWVLYLKPLVIAALGRHQPTSKELARQASGRLLAALDDELAAFLPVGKAELMGFLYPELTARLVTWTL